MELDSSITVGELMAQHPSTTSVFMSRRLMCVGCPAQAYHTLRDVARIYGYELDDFVETMGEAIHKREES